MSLDSAMADRITGLVLFALGIAMLVGGYTMDRLEIRQIHPASIPGLVPMGLGVAMAICAGLLVFSSKPPTTATKAASKEPGSYQNLAVTLVLSLGYAAGMVGKMPFMLATGIYIFLFTAYFLLTNTQTQGLGKLKLILLLALFSTIVSVGISVLFEVGFLVRLP